MEPQGRFLSVDLRHVLAVLGQDALDSEWVVRNAWATGNAGDEFDRLIQGKRVPGAKLNALANDVVQVIDGEFIAFKPGQTTPWVRVFADDSTLYEVETDDDEVARKIFSSFRQTENGLTEQPAPCGRGTAP